MRILIINNETVHLEDLICLLPAIVEISPWNSPLNAEIGSYDCVVLSGSKNHSVVWEAADFIAEHEIILSAKIPIIGICFGAELIAQAYGGSLSRLERRARGIKNIRTIDSGERLIEQSEFQVYEGHQWSITDLPNTFDKLASSTDGIELFRHKTKPIYGMQFHPEGSGGKDGKRIFLRILGKLLSVSE